MVGEWRNWHPPATQAKQASLAGVAGGDEHDFMNMFYTYVLKSEKDKKLYVGFSKDLRKRIDEHNNGLVPATKNRYPLVLIYYEACTDKKSALAREKYFKTGFGRRFLKNRLDLKNIPALT